VAEVIAEIGVPMADAFPNPLHRQLVEAADVIITMGCGDACPLLPGRVYEGWNLPDPSGMSVEQLRQLREQIDSRVRTLVERLRAMGSFSGECP
jgi:protein-tyrosine-phosphatase